MFVKKYKSAALKGKLRVANYLKSHPSLKYLVPETVSFSYHRLQNMARKYSSLYIKPNIGSQGIGIYKITGLPNKFTLYSSDTKRKRARHFYNLAALYHYLAAHSTGKMIIQQGITLDKFNGHPYDIRAMVQRKPGSSWTCTGFLVKVGSARKIVTNYFQGGKIKTIQQLLRVQHVPGAERPARIRYLSATAVDISKALSRKKSGMREMGIDLAYDNQQHLWVLEVNSNHPEFHPLKWLDRSQYNRMLAYARSYGRYK